MRVHLVDGTFELFRAHFAPRPSKIVGGVDLKATAGLVGSMLALLEDPDEAVTHLAIAFDNPIVSFRNDLFDAYKSDEGVPPSLRAQFDVAEVAAKALGIVVWSMDKYEADDALATAAVRFAAPGRQVRILTPDKDLGQVLSGDRVVQVDRIRRKVIDEEAMRTRRGVAPESIPDLLALVGDTSDGIPGLPGFGEKSAGALLGHYGTIEAIPLDAAAWKPKVTGAPRLAATLAARREDALLYKRLATLVRDVPLPESLDDLAYRGAPRGPFEEVCVRLEIRPRFSRFRT
jgi:5'-3' exonuclease